MWCVKLNWHTTSFLLIVDLITQYYVINCCHVTSVDYVIVVLVAIDDSAIVIVENPVVESGDIGSVAHTIAVHVTFWIAFQIGIFHVAERIVGHLKIGATHFHATIHVAEFNGRVTLECARVVSVVGLTFVKIIILVATLEIVHWVIVTVGAGVGVYEVAGIGLSNEYHTFLIVRFYPLCGFGLEIRLVAIYGIACGNICLEFVGYLKCQS